MSHSGWVQIAGLYDVLAAIAPSPVVEVNRAAAIGFASGASERRLQQLTG